MISCFGFFLLIVLSFFTNCRKVSHFMDKSMLQLHDQISPNERSRLFALLSNCSPNTIILQE